jgi:hypothetical protein
MLQNATVVFNNIQWIRYIVLSSQFRKNFFFPTLFPKKESELSNAVLIHEILAGRAYLILFQVFSSVRNLGWIILLIELS